MGNCCFNSSLKTNKFEKWLNGIKQASSNVFEFEKWWKTFTDYNCLNWNKNICLKWNEMNCNVMKKMIKEVKA